MINLIDLKGDSIFIRTDSKLLIDCMSTLLKTMGLEFELWGLKNTLLSLNILNFKQFINYLIDK